MSEFTSGQRLYTFQRATFMRTSFDEHALVIAAGNLAKAMERAPKFLRKILPKESLRVLQLLRNNYEHWEQMRAAFRKGGPEKADAALSITKEFPDAKPWTIALHLNGDIDLANVVLLKALNGDLRKLEASAHWRQRQLRKEGRHKATEEPRPIRKKNGLAAGEANSPNRGLKRTSDAAA